MISETGVDGVMIGRAAVGNPWIFQETYSRFNDIPWIPHSLEEHRSIIFEHLEQLIQLKHKERRFRRKNSLTVDQAAVLHFRAHLHQYLRGFRGWPDVRRNLNTMHQIEEVKKAVDWVLSCQAS